MTEQVGTEDMVDEHTGMVHEGTVERRCRWTWVASEDTVVEHTGMVQEHLRNQRMLVEDKEHTGTTCMDIAGMKMDEEETTREEYVRGCYLHGSDVGKDRWDSLETVVERVVEDVGQVIARRRTHLPLLRVRRGR